MCALYAFLRRTDDLGDSDGAADVRRRDLQAWRDALDAAWEGEFRDPILPALADTVRRYEIPREYLSEVIDGVEMDLEPGGYETFVDLTQYCYRVASVVGLSCIHIWGYSDPAAKLPAQACGLGFQLTNILRDLREDAARGRCYLPRQDLARFEFSTAEFLHYVTDPAGRNAELDAHFQQLIAFEIERAETCFFSASVLANYLTSDGRRIFAGMCGTYHRLLHKIAAAPAEVLRRRINLSRGEKGRIVAAAALAPRRLLVALALNPSAGLPALASRGAPLP
jgi:phytoene synthase